MPEQSEEKKPVESSISKKKRQKKSPSGANEKNLHELTEVWKSMERRTLEQREKASKYYDQHLIWPIIEEYRTKNENRLLENVKYLIMSVGTSYEPIVLNISLLRPEKILFLYTKQTDHILNKIVRFLNLEANVYQKQLVDATDSLSVYYEIKQAYISWGRPQKVYIDFTGGTKTMSAAAALAGSIIDVQMVYVGTGKYLTDFRKPEPGSEELFYIDNPMEVFGDLELEKVFALINRFNYSGAAEKLMVLKEKIPDPMSRQQLNFIYLLVKVYEHWDALEFPAAYEKLEQLIGQLRRDYRVYKNILLMDMQQQLREQLEVLKELNRIPDYIREKKQPEILKQEKVITALMFTMYTNAQRREFQEKYDMATLLLYRLLEMIQQRRLIRYNIYVSRPEYGGIEYEHADPDFAQIPEAERLAFLKSRYFQLKKKLFPKTEKDYLPSQIALLDGYLILAALGDPMLEQVEGGSLNLLRRVRAMVSLRNNSIFAHGLGPVTYADYSRFRDFVADVFRMFCTSESVDFESYTEVCKFRNPIQKDYSSMLGEKL